MRIIDKYLLFSQIGIGLLLFILSGIYLINSSIRKPTNLPQAPRDCRDTPCTVSPYRNYYGQIDASITREADFPSLQVALEAVKDQPGAKLILLGIADNVTVSERFPGAPHQLATIKDSKAHLPGIPDYAQPVIVVPIDQDVHLIGEEVADINKMPVLTSDVFEFQGLLPVVCGSENNCVARPIVHFKDMTGSIDNLAFLFNYSMNERGIREFTREQANDINYVPKVVQVENSNLDIKNCRFVINNATDKVEVNVPTSENDILYFRAVALDYANSQGSIQGNRISGDLAGGFWIHGGGQLQVKNNQFSETDWFSLIVNNANAIVEGNVAWAIDGRHFNECYKNRNTPTCQDWIGPLPLWDYSVTGLAVSGQDNLTLIHNTIMGYNTNLSISSVKSGSAEKNILIKFEDIQGSGAIKINDSNIDYDSSTNLDYGWGVWAAGWTTGKGIFDINACGDLGNPVAPSWSGESLSTMAAGGANAICSFWLKEGTEAYLKQAGASFASGWDKVTLMHKEGGCAKLPLTCISILSCNQEVNTCLKPGEDPHASPSPAGGGTHKPFGSVRPYTGAKEPLPDTW